MRNPLHLREMEVCFGNWQKKFGIDDEIGSLLEHLSLRKGKVFGIGERNMYSAEDVFIFFSYKQFTESLNRKL